MGKVVDKTYSFHELYQKFATEKLTGGRNTKTCITASAGNRYMAQFKLYINQISLIVIFMKSEEGSYRNLSIGYWTMVISLSF